MSTVVNLTTKPVRVYVKLTGMRGPAYVSEEVRLALLSARDDALLARNEAINAMNDASSSANTALTARSNASTSEINAHASEVSAAESENNAKTYKVYAETSASQAKVSEDNAKASEDNAKTSENNVTTMRDEVVVARDETKAYAESVYFNFYFEFLRAPYASTLEFEFEDVVHGSPGYAFPPSISIGLEYDPLIPHDGSFPSPPNITPVISFVSHEVSGILYYKGFKVHWLGGTVPESLPNTYVSAMAMIRKW